ncbi:hypothetical protein ACFQVA_27085 [Actinomadura keratinilytica]
MHPTHQHRQQVTHGPKPTTHGRLPGVRHHQLGQAAPYPNADDARPSATPHLAPRPSPFALRPSPFALRPQSLCCPHGFADAVSRS